MRPQQPLSRSESVSVNIGSTGRAGDTSLPCSYVFSFFLSKESLFFCSFKVCVFGRNWSCLRCVLESVGFAKVRHTWKCNMHILSNCAHDQIYCLVLKMGICIHKRLFMHLCKDSKL